MNGLGECAMFAEIAENLAAGTVSFAVRVQPRASKDEIAGVMDGRSENPSASACSGKSSERGPDRIPRPSFENAQVGC